MESLPTHLINNIYSFLPLTTLEQLEEQGVPNIKKIIINKITNEFFSPEIFNYRNFCKYKDLYKRLLNDFINKVSDEYLKPVDNMKEGKKYIYEIKINYKFQVKKPRCPDVETALITTQRDNKNNIKFSLSCCSILETVYDFDFIKDPNATKISLECIFDWIIKRPPSFFDHLKFIHNEINPIQSIEFKVYEYDENQRIDIIFHNDDKKCIKYIKYY